MKLKGSMLVMILICSMLFIFGCNKTNKDTEDKASVTIMPTQNATINENAGASTTVVPTVEPTIAPSKVELPVPATSYVTDEMYANAMLNEGNLARLAAAMKKAQKGEEITVAVIGGSITQGTAASTPDNNYASLFYKWWTTAFPKAKINFVNAGIGATTSYLGVHRVDKDLLSYHPDVVVVEFSVNDTNTLFYKETYEDLVRRILKQDNMPAIIQLFMTMEDGTSAVTQHLLVGFKYDLPRISYGQTVLKEIAKGTFTWQDISPDNIHPNDKGHAIVGEILWRYLNSVYAKLDTITEQPTPMEVEPYFSEAYIDATILDSETITPTSLGSFKKASVFDRFKNDWQTTSGKDAIEFEVEAQNIGIMYFKTVDGLSGQFDVYIDDKFVVKLDANFKGGWGNYAETIEVYRSKDKVKHKIEIKKSSGSTGDVFSVLGLLIS